MLALELPPVAGPVVLTPTVAAVWRMRDDRASLVAGAAGVALAVATLGMWPRTPRRAARGVLVGERGGVDLRPDGTGLTIVVNVAAGSASNQALIDHVRTELPGARIVEVADSATLSGALAEAARDGTALGVLGGDGSANAAAAAALEAGVPLVVFPGGTLNHFARDLGLDSVTEAVDAVGHGHVATVDIGTVADRVFLNSASIGSYAELVDERERLEPRLGKWPAMSVALVRVLLRWRRFEVVIDGETRRIWMAFFGNGTYEPAGFAPADRPDLVDGVIDLRVINATSPFSRSRLVAAMLLGALARSRVYEQRCVRSVSVRSAADESIRVTVDGESFDGPAELVFGKRLAALRVLVPLRS